MKVAVVVLISTLGSGAAGRNQATATRRHAEHERDAALAAGPPNCPPDLPLW